MRQSFALLVGAALLAGCGIGSGESQPSTPAPPTDCAGFLALSDEQRATFVSGSSLDDGLKHMRFYSDSAAHLTVRELWERECPAEPAKSLESYLYDEAGRADCTRFVDLPWSVRESWVSVLHEGMEYDLNVSMSMLHCELFGSVDLDDDHENVARMGLRPITWEQESKLGYRTQVRFGIPTGVTKGVIEHPYSGAEVGAGCAFDPDKDLAIPVSIQVRNSTAGANPDFLAAAVWLEVDRDLTKVTTASLEKLYSDDVDCESAGTAWTPGGPKLSHRWTNTNGDPIDSGYGSDFLIIHHYFSPRYPNGAVDELAASEFYAAAAQGSADDPISLVGEQVSINVGQAVSG